MSRMSPDGAGVSRPAVWCWQQRYAEADVEGLLRGKPRPLGKLPHLTETVAEVLPLACSEPPSEVTHCTGRAVASAVGISWRAVQRISALANALFGLTDWLWTGLIERISRDRRS